MQYIKAALPSTADHKFYFDYGTVGLDSMYQPNQLKIDEILREKGYSKRNWRTYRYDGANHSENSWSKRLDTPLLFLLGNK